MATVIRLGTVKRRREQQRGVVFCGDVWGLIKEFMLEKSGRAQQFSTLCQSGRLGDFFWLTARNRAVLNKLKTTHPSLRSHPEQILWKNLLVLLLGDDAMRTIGEWGVIRREATDPLPNFSVLFGLHENHWYRKKLFKFALQLTLPKFLYPHDDESVINLNTRRRSLPSEDNSALILDIEKRTRECVQIVDDILTGKRQCISNYANPFSLVRNPLFLPYLYYIGDRVQILVLDGPPPTGRMMTASPVPLNISPLKHVSDLESLSLNKVSLCFDSFIEMVPSFQKLEHLNLQNTGLTGLYFYRLLVQLETPMLKRVDFSYNDIGGIPPVGLHFIVESIENVALNYLSQLEEFYVSYCNLSFDAVCALATNLISKCPKMLHFHVNGNLNPRPHVDKNAILQALVPGARNIRIEETVYLRRTTNS